MPMPAPRRRRRSSRRRGTRRGTANCRCDSPTSARCDTRSHIMTDSSAASPAPCISVSDKTGLVDFARALAGTASSSSRPAAPRKALADAGLEGARRVGAHRLSGDDGRPGEDAAPQGAWRPARDPRQQGPRRARCSAHGIAPIDLLVVNLYPFEATVAKGADFDDCIENIDIGGPAMIRAAAKNHADVAVVVDAADYARVARGARRSTAARPRWRLRKKLAAKAYARTARLRRRDLQLVRGTARRSRAGLPRVRRHARRSRCATARTRTSRRRSTARPSSAPASPPRGRCRASSSPTTTSTTPTRPIECVAEFDPKRTRGLRHRQARQSLRRGRGREPGRGLSQGAAPAIRSPPSAASWRSTARSTPRPRAPSPRSSPRSSSRPTRARKRSPSSARRRICACCSPAACPIRAPPA